MITVLSGGTGTPKLLQGLKEIIDPKDIVVIVNTAEDEWLSHGYFSPDVDTVLYTLADMIDDSCWHGIRGDTFKTHEKLNELGYNERLKIGDMDRATHIQRGSLIKSGMSLSEAVDVQRKALGVKAKVLPMTDDTVETVVKTSEKDMDFHEFWVANKGEPEVLDVNYKGISKASPSKEAVNAIRKADRIIIGPSNPITSILPIISLSGMLQELKSRRKRCIAVSPIIGDKPLSGPAGKLMNAKGYGTTSVNVAEIYKGLISKFVVDNVEKDRVLEEIKKLEIECFKTNTIMNSHRDKISLSRFLIKIDLN